MNTSHLLIYMVIPELMKGDRLMFILSMKMTRKKTVAALSFFLALSVVFTIFLSTNGVATDVVNNSNKKITDLAAENNEQRINYLNQFGWEVNQEPSEIVEVAIPTEFNDVYERYNVIQKKQGFDLSPYRGKTVKRWTYDVANYPDNRPNVKANILVYENKIIGGDIYSLELDGFMHGFKLE